MPGDADLSKYPVSREYRPGEYIFHEGDPGDSMLVIQRGQVAIIKGADTRLPVVLGYRGEGEGLGEISLLQNTPRTASVMAVEPTTVYLISAEQFWQEFDHNPAFRRMVVNTLIEHVLAADQSRMRLAESERAQFARLSSIVNEHDRLEALMQLRQETMRFIVHDLRNPLNLVMFALSMIEDSCPDDPSGELNQFIRLANGAVQRVLTMADAMLEVERLEMGEVRLDLVPIDLGAMLAEIVERLQPMASSYLVRLGIGHLAPGLPPVQADRQRIERVITNLIDNAFKFAPPESEVLVSLERQGDSLVVSVDDTGPGVPPNLQERIFDRFARFDPPDSRPKGFGLGLAFCRLAVQAHNGRIWVEQGRRGGGTCIRFTLPLSGEANGGK
ncbi:MAG: hypothetical protein Kow00124_21820 [Anaerolineae bacterium]